MNSFLSKLGASSAGLPQPPVDFAAAPEGNGDSFRSLFEQTLQRPRETNNPTAHNASRQTRNSEAQQDTRDTRTDARPASGKRERKVKSDESEAQNLAGACAVVNQVMATETEVVATEIPPDATASETTESAINLTGKRPVRVDRDALSHSALFAGKYPEQLSDNHKPVQTAISEAKSLLPSESFSLTQTQLQPTSGTAVNQVASAQPAIPSSGGTELMAQLNAVITRELSEIDTPEPTTPDELTAPPVIKQAAAVPVEAAQVEPIDGKVGLPNAENFAAVTTANAETVRREAQNSRVFHAEQAIKARGTGSAKTGETMKTVLRKEDFAGGTEQLLPDAPAPLLDRDLVREFPRRDSKAVSLESSEAGRIAPSPARLDVSSLQELTERPTVSPLVRAGELISREVRLFKRSGDDLVEVVLTPDVKTQISLRLQWREGQVEVQARCDFGDYRSLSTEWPQLQAALAAHGVRLSHLGERVATGFTDFFNNPGFSQQRHDQQQSHAERSGSERVIAIPAPSGKSGTTSPAPVRNKGLVDFWA